MQRHAERTYISAPRIVTAGSAGTILDGTVVIEGGRISAVDRGLHQGPRTTVFRDSTILPGIVDAHAHLTLFADLRRYEEMMQEPNEMMVLVGLRNLRRHLESGVTTIRDNGARDRTAFQLRDAILRGYFVGPRLLLSGRPITHSHGHFHFQNEIADGDDEIRRSVRRLVAEGADHIKIMASGGGTAGNQPFHPSYTSRELRVAVETAHDLGRLTTAHCRSRQSMVNALEAGLDCIEHAEFLVPKGPHPLGRGGVGEATMQYDERLAEQLLRAETKVSFTPQTGGWDSLVRLRAAKDERDLSDDESRRLTDLEAYYAEKLDILGKLISDGFAPKLAISSDAGPYDTEFGRMQYGVDLAVRARDDRRASDNRDHQSRR